MKRCFKCGKEKKIGLFYKHKQMKDGHLNKCIECAKVDSLEIRQKKIDYYREYDRNRKNKKERTEKLKEKNTLLKKLNIKLYREKRNEYSKKYRAKNREKRIAHSRLFYALSVGKLKNPCMCENCGKETFTEGHHEDYSKPFMVKWLCDECHKKRHIEMRAEARRGK